MTGLNSFIMCPLYQLFLFLLNFSKKVGIIFLEPILVRSPELFIYLFNKHLLDIYSVIDPVLGPRTREVKKTKNVPTL